MASTTKDAQIRNLQREVGVLSLMLSSRTHAEKVFRKAYIDGADMGRDVSAALESIEHQIRTGVLYPLVLAGEVAALRERIERGK